VTEKFHFAILRIEVTRASRGLSTIAELFVFINYDPNVFCCKWQDVQSLKRQVSGLD